MNGFYILPSFYEAVTSLPVKDQGEMWCGIMAYGMQGQEPAFTKCHLKAVFALIKPVIDSQNRKATQSRANGTKGGRPKNPKETQEEPKNNPDITQEEPKGHESNNLTETQKNHYESESESESDKGQGIKDKGQGIKDNTLSPLPSLPVEGRTTPPKRESPSERLELFDRFWKAYPRKEGKAAAAKAWNDIQPDEALVARMVSAVEAKKRSPEWTQENGKFIPHPAKWLSERRWEDEMPGSREPERRLSAAEMAAIDELMRGDSW